MLRVSSRVSSVKSEQNGLLAGTYSTDDIRVAEAF